MQFLFIHFSNPCYTSLTIWIPMVYASTNEHLCIAAAFVAEIECSLVLADITGTQKC